MFEKAKLAIPTYAAKKKFEESFKPPQEPDEILLVLKRELARHEKADDRFMMWLAEALEESRLVEYVETEAELSHYRDHGYEKAAAECFPRLARIESEWRIATTLVAYFRAISIAKSAEGLGEFFARTYPKSGKPAKAAKPEDKKGGP